MLIGLIKVHRRGPGEGLRRVENPGAALTVLVVKGLDILDAGPHPGAGLPLACARSVANRWAIVKKARNPPFTIAELS